MRQLRKRLLAIVACVAMVVSMLPQSGIVLAADSKEAVTYKIYPTPHEMTYADGETDISSEVNVVFESTIDDVTKARLNEVLASKEITASVTDAVVEGKTNILVGTYGSEEYVDTYVAENASVEAGLFDKFSGHYVSVADDMIVVLGVDTDAAFYGITSLKHIFAQMEGKTIRNLTIKDYADTKIRGFIEGYYGIPWSNEDRMSLMEFGGEFKMTSYVFAPKDDPYHTSKWRQLYPADEIAEIAEMVKVGNDTKCKFVWTAHPFMGGFNSNDVNGEIDALLKKFDQLYSVGVRQFGVLGDDVGQLNRQVVIQVMEAVSEWAKAKGDVYDSVFCPAGYNHAWQGDYSELNQYDAGFPDDIQIFWTGEAVCQPVEQKTLDHFKNQNATNGSRRSPLFWLNWPVNDINGARLMMGKGSLLHTDITVSDLVGVVTNPMQEAEASKVAIFAVADYSWNVKDFNDDQSWADSFAYIDADAANELHTLAKHMSDPAPNGHGLVLEESEALNPLLTEYAEKLEAGTLNAEDNAAMIAEFEAIAAACDGFHNKSKNANLKEELLPYTSALKEKALAAIEFIQTQQAVATGDEAAAWSHYSQASAYLTASKNHSKALINGGSTLVSPGSKRIEPFLNKLNTTLSPIVISMIDDSKIFGTFITSRTDTPSGNVDNILDGDVASNAIFKSPAAIYEGDFVGVKYSKKIEINDIRFVLGAGKDHFDEGKLQYTEDGTTWKDLELVGMDNLFTGVINQVQDVVVEEANLPADFSAMGIRFIATKDNARDAWLEVREIVINKVEKDGEVTAYTGTISVPSGYGIYQGDVSSLTDGSDSSFVWYRTPNNTVTVGDCITLDLGSEVSIGTIHFAMPSGDCLSNYTLQYSADGSTYTDIQTFTTLTADVDLSGEGVTARYVRVKNNVNTEKWLKVAEFTVSPAVERIDAIFTNMDDVKGLFVNMTNDTATLAGTKELTVAPGEYVGIALDRIKDVEKITVAGADALTLETSKNNVVWTEVTGDTYEDARYIRLVNNTDKDVKVDFKSLVVESFEISPISVVSTNFGDAGTHLKAFDQDRTTEAVLQASQLAGKYITYDLGQVIDLETLKVVLHDGTTDYPRHAKVSVSLDGKEWTDVLVIGNQDAANEGEAENSDDISDLFPVHEISYYTLEAKDIDAEVRFIKFEITRDKAGADKWVRIREIELNGGNMYMAEANDPTIVTDAKESKGNVLANMIDGDLSTIFQPVGDAAGSLTYSISENTEVKRINILQSPTTISNAEVTAEVVVDGTVKTVKLGKLSSSLNKFNTTAYDNVLAVTITWTEGNVPRIHEIITLTTAGAEADKSALESYYNEVKDTDTSNWTDETKAAFEEALELAETVLAKNGATAEEINNAIATLEAAINNKEEKPAVDKTEAQKYYDDCAERYAEEDYTEESWAVYKTAMKALEAALADDEITAEKLQEAVNAVSAAVNALVEKEEPVDPEDPEDPVDPENPEEPVDPEAPKDPTTPEEPDNTDKEEDKSPSTGDATTIMLWAVMMVMAAAVVVLRKKER